MNKTHIISTLATLMLTGCAFKQPLQQRESPSVTVNSKASTDAYSQAPEVVRYDRYLLVSTDPVTVQRDPLSQIIDIRIPASIKPTVADALRYALRQSGYSLCATGPANGVMYRQPLPAVHYQLGPIRLRTALQVLGGPAWQLEVDDVQRVVCHSLRAGYQLPKTQLPPTSGTAPATAVAPAAVKSMPATGGWLKK